MIEPLESVRVEKLKSIEALGHVPYPTEYRDGAGIIAGIVCHPQPPPNPMADEYDAQREAFLRSHGISVLRFENREIFDNLDYLLEAIRLRAAS